MKRENTGALLENVTVKDALFRLALPTVLGQMITVFYNMADTFFIGMLADDARMTAVTVAMPCFMLLSAISNLFGIGGAGALSRALGRGEGKEAGDIAAFSFWGCLAATLIYSLSVFLFVDPVADLLGGTDPRVHGEAVTYLLIAVSAGGLATSLGALLSHLIRAEGRGLEASLGIALGGVLNVILDPLFMFCIMPEGMEVAGAALATAVSNLFTLIFFSVVMARSRRQSVLSLSARRAWAGRTHSSDILSSGFPAFTMTLCENVSYAVLDSLMAGFGIAVQAGAGVAKKINMLAHSIVRGTAQGMLPLIAFTYASGDRARMRKASRCSSLFSVVSALLCMTVSLVFADPLAGIFLESGSASAEAAARLLRLLALGAPFSAFAYTSISFFQAAGRGGRSLFLALLRKGMLDIPLMLLLVRARGAYGAAAATPLADAVCALFAAVMMFLFMHRETQASEKDGAHVKNTYELRREAI